MSQQQPVAERTRSRRERRHAGNRNAQISLVAPRHRRWQAAASQTTQSYPCFPPTLPSQPTAERALGSNLEVGEPTALTRGNVHALRDYIETSNEASARYYAAADTNRWWNRTLSITVNILLYLTTGGSVLSNIFAMQPSDPAFPYSVSITVLLFVITVLRSVDEGFGFRLKMTNYEMTGDDFMHYARTWARRLLQGVDDRADKCAEAVVTAEQELAAIELHALPLYVAPHADHRVQGADGTT